jgi:hypothetical protein
MPDVRPKSDVERFSIEDNWRMPNHTGASDELKISEHIHAYRSVICTIHESSIRL